MRMTLLIVVTFACAVCAAPLAAQQDAGEACTFTEIGRAPLVVDDGLELYVEPQSLIRLDTGELLLAGTPNYLWRRGPDQVEPIARDSLFGVIIARDHARPVPPPLPAQLIFNVRVVARPGGGWSAGFVEGTRARERGGEPIDVARLRHAVHHDGAWRLLEEVPLPPGYHATPYASSRLALRGDTLWWAVDARHERRLNALFLLARSADGVWSNELIRERAAYVDLAAPELDGLRLLVVGTDPTLPGDRNSLFLYTRNDDLRSLKLVAGLDAPVHFPALAETSDGLLATWLTWQADHFEAHAVREPEHGMDRALTVDVSADRVVPVVTRDGRSFLVTDHIVAGHDRLVRVIELDDDTGRERLRMPSPFRGYFNAVMADDDVLLIAGPIVTLDPTPSVTTLLIRLSTACGGASP